jgi:protein MpaA
MRNKLAQPRQTGQDNLTILLMLERRLLSKSASNQEIWMYRIGRETLPKWFLIGGVHGDEPEGAQLVDDFILKAQSIASRFSSQVIAIPKFNPDGLGKNERVNGNSVDLNRNFPSHDWIPDVKAPRYNPGPSPESESEVKALVKLLKDEKPFLVVHCHTYIPQINYTGEISKIWAEKLSTDFPYPITDNIGYPTPGSLGQYCFYNLATPCVCIELPEKVEREVAWKLMGPSLLAVANGTN